MPVIIRRRSGNPVSSIPLASQEYITESLDKISTLTVSEPTTQIISIIEDTPIKVIVSSKEETKVPTKDTLSSRLPRIYTDFKTVDSDSGGVKSSNIGLTPLEFNSVHKQYTDSLTKAFKSSEINAPNNEPKSTRESPQNKVTPRFRREHKNPSKITKPILPSGDTFDELEALDHIKCLDCKDTRKILVYETCDNCLGKGCKYCYNTGDIKTYIPCQSCNSKPFKFNR